MFDENFVLTKVQSLLSQSAKMHGSLQPPIDPAILTDLCAVLSVEHRPMVPEGVLTPVPGGFKIYLQSNFTHRSGMKFRRRFTLAHELIHTFFYNLNGGVPEPVKKSPRGQSLERLCHIGACQILVPDFLLRQELKTKGEVASVESILDLARLFDVSVEVLMRRLHQLGLIADDKFAAILVHTADGGRHLIRAACYGSLLLCNANRPMPGMDFDFWVRPLLAPTASPRDSAWVRTTQTATIMAKKVFRSNRSFILDLRFDRPTLDPS
jgi:hypothetical protein